jgi:hypothetical protein
MKAAIPTDAFRPEGSRFDEDSTPQKEMMTGSILDGRINIGGDLVYWLSSLLMEAAVPGTWTFLPDNYNPNTITTYTMERGTGTTGERASFVCCDSLEFTWNRTQANMRGTVFGQVLTPGQTMNTTSVTKTTKALAIPGKVRVMVGTSIGGLAKITGCVQAGLSIRGTHGPQFYLDDADTTYGKVVALAPTVGARLVVENDSVANGYLTDLRNSTLKFLRIISYGPSGYSAQFTMPFKFSDDDFVDTDNLDTVAYDLRPLNDSSLLSAIEVVVTNTMVAY